jgi:tetratricopeptide (TPR) repeat protein
MTRPGRNEIRLRHARHYLEVCEEALRLLSSGGDRSEIIKDVPNVMEAQNAATELAELMPEANAMCWQFPFALGVGGASLIGLDRTIQWNEKGLAIAQLATPGEPRLKVELQLSANLGYLFSMAGDLSQSRDSYGAAYRLAHALNRPLRVGELAGHVGEVLCELGDYHLASRFLEQSRDGAVGGSPRQQAVAQLRLGRLHRSMGQPKIALNFLRIAWDLAASAGLEDLAPTVVSEIATICKDAGNYQLAIAFYKRILENITRHPNPHLEGRITAALGDVYFYANDLDAARAHYGKAIAIFGRTGDKVSDGRTQAGIGAVLAAQGRSSEALGYFKLSLATASKHGDREGIEKARRNISAFCAQLGGQDAVRLRAEAETVLNEVPYQQLPRGTTHVTD